MRSAARSSKTISFWRSIEGCSRRTAGRWFPWRFAWPTRFRWEWGAAHRRRDGWRRSRWLSISDNWAGRDEQILEEASALEGHPDNAAACWLGGYVSAATEGRTVHVARVTPPAQWRAIVVLPAEPLATSKARAVLPASYTRDDVIANLQSVSLLGLAFAQARGDLLRVAMCDRIHQPYRAAICPMLPRSPASGGPGGHPGSGVERRRTGGAGDRRRRRPRGECGSGDPAALSTACPNRS